MGWNLDLSSQLFLTYPLQQGLRHRIRKHPETKSKFLAYPLQQGLRRVAVEDELVELAGFLPIHYNKD